MKPPAQSHPTSHQPHPHQPVGGEQMSEQEKQFDAMFQKWEEQFDTWKIQNRDNPDQAYVSQHVANMNKMRQALLGRRENLRTQRPPQSGKPALTGPQGPKGHASG